MYQICLCFVAARGLPFLDDETTGATPRAVIMCADPLNSLHFGTSTDVVGLANHLLDTVLANHVMM